VTPRPRKVSDEAIYTAAIRAMGRLGPADLTLAEIAAEAGLTASALVQRFGSKRALLLTMSEQLAASTEGFITGLEAAHRSPLAALRAYADCMAGLAVSPAALFRNLAYLQIDLTDPEFRTHLEAQARGTRAGLEALLASARRAGELIAGVDSARLARTIEAVLSGSMLTWGFYRKGTAARWMRDDLEAVLAPYLPPRRAGAAARRRTVIPDPPAAGDIPAGGPRDRHSSRKTRRPAPRRSDRDR
jgi:AcrR family transcriptional regulator